ncbi:MAG: hypothetical protein F6K24_46990, partial [Okeania sp. SIO2D1]|nr:hypothetical protein [Okeania sp. SIO2D1]
QNDSPSSGEVSEEQKIRESQQSEEKPVAKVEDRVLNLSEIIGTKEDGWLPKPIAQKDLTRDMSPEEAGKILPGAEEVSEFGFSEVKEGDVPGLEGYELYFAKNDAGVPAKLQTVTLILDPSIKDELTFEEAAKEVAEKYGEYEEIVVDDKITSYLWIGPKFASTSLSNLGSDFEGYKLEVTLPE